MLKAILFVIIMTGILTGSTLAVQPQPGEWKATGDGKFGNDSTGFIIFELVKYFV